MSELKPNKPRWRKKRWWLTGLLVASLSWIYVLSAGPAIYLLIYRGWGSLWGDEYGESWDVLYDPADAVLSVTPLERSWDGYLKWWARKSGEWTSEEELQKAAASRSEWKDVRPSPEEAAADAAIDRTHWAPSTPSER